MEPEKAAKEEKSKDPENVGDGKQDVKPPKSDVNTDMEGGNKNEEKEIEDNKSLTRESEPREPVATVHDESTETLDTDQSALEEIVETVADQLVSEETVETSEDQPASEEILETNANQPVSEQIVETDLSEEIVEIDSNQPVSEVIVGADENQPVSEEIVETDANELVSEEIVETDANQPETEDIIEAVPEAATASEDNPKDKDGTLSTEEEKKTTEGNATKPMNERRGRKRKASSDDEAKDDSIAAASEQKSSDKINDSKDENLDKIEDSKDEKSSKTDEFTENAADRIKSRKRKASEMLTGTEGSASEEGEVAKMETEKDNHTLNNASELGMPPKQTFGKGKRARIPNKRYSDIMLPAQGRHKSPSSASVPPNVENGSTKKTEKVEKVEKIEPEVVASTSKVEPSTSTPNPRSNTSSPALKRNKGPSVNVKDKIFLKPMKRGWKRELVVRGVQDSSSEKRTCDIYYYTPEGKKLRSMREVADFLLYNRVKELTIQNFTFYKEPLGLNDPAKEIIRNAQGARTPKVLSPKLNSPKVGQDTPPVKRAAPVPSQLATKSVDSTSTPKMNEVASSSKERGQQQQSPSPSKSKRVTRNLGGFKVKLTPAKDKPAVSEKRIASIALARAAKVQKASLRAAANKAATSTPSTPSPGKQQIKEEKMEIVETPVNNNNNKKNNAARKTGGTTPAAAAKTPAPVVASTNLGLGDTEGEGGTSITTTQKPCQPCSIRCEGVSGMVPTLQCRLCLCLYHYECVGLSPHVLIEAYVCKNCQLEHGQQQNNDDVATSASIALPPLLTPSINSVTMATATTPQQSPPSDRNYQSPAVAPASLSSPHNNNSSATLQTTPGITSATTVSMKLNLVGGRQPDASAASPHPAATPSPGVGASATNQFVGNNKRKSPDTVTGGGMTIINTESNNNNKSSSLLGSVTTWLPPSSTIRVDREPLEAPRPQYVEYLAGRKFLIIPKHNVVSISPSCGAIGGKQQQQPPPPLSQQQHVDVMSGSQSERHSLLEQGPGDGADALKTAQAVAGRSADDIKDEPSSPSAAGYNNYCGGGGGDGREQHQNNMDTSTTTDALLSEKDGRTTNLESVESPKAKRRATKLNNVTSEKSSSGGGPLTLMGSYLQNMSYGYTTLLSVFQYLKVQDLLRAGCVCTMWRDMAGHPSLWRTVRMKNSQVHSFQGLANTLQKHGTVHLDLRKMLLPTTEGDNIWPEFSKAIEKVQSLRKIELCRCPASVVEKLAVTNKELEVINAVTIKCESMSLDKLKALKNLKELRLKSTSGLTLSSDITALKGLTQLKNLSLTSIKDLNKLNLSVISALTNLESLDLGECTDLPDNFGCDILIKLTKLEKLRLEKGQGNCHTFEILDAIQNMPQLEQLELVNFDIKPGFDVALGACKNLKKLLVIPTYISQSATTNHMVLGGVLRLQSTLSHFVWGVTLELLRVTELFVDQCEDPDKKDKKERKQVGNGDSIPVLKPVPLITDKDDAILPAHDPPQVEILPLPNLQKLLLQSLPTTRVKILKIPFHATWRQNITDTVN